MRPMPIVRHHRRRPCCHLILPPRLLTIRVDGIVGMCRRRATSRNLHSPRGPSPSRPTPPPPEKVRQRDPQRERHQPADDRTRDGAGGGPGRCIRLGAGVARACGRCAAATSWRAGAGAAVKGALRGGGDDVVAVDGGAKDGLGAGGDDGGRGDVGEDVGGG